MDYSNYRNKANEAGGVAWSAVLIVVFVSVLIMGMLFWSPIVTQVDRLVTTHSTSFVQSRQEELVQKANEYQRLDTLAKNADTPEARKEYTDQREGVKSYMQRVAATMPSDTVPSEARRVIGGY